MKIIIDIEAGEKECGKCGMQMRWDSGQDKYVDCVINGETVATGKARSVRQPFCLAAEEEYRWFQQGKTKNIKGGA